MSIRSMYRQSAVTYREDFVAGSTVKKALVEHLEEFPCAIQPMSAEATQQLPGGFAKSWIMFCPVNDFKEGDKVVVDDTDEYRITGIETFDFSSNPHAEVTLTAFRE